MVYPQKSLLYFQYLYGHYFLLIGTCIVIIYRELCANHLAHDQLRLLVLEFQNYTIYCLEENNQDLHDNLDLMH